MILRLSIYSIGLTYSLGTLWLLILQKVIQEQLPVRNQIDLLQNQSSWCQEGEVHIKRLDQYCTNFLYLSFSFLYFADVISTTLVVNLFLQALFEIVAFAVLLTLLLCKHWLICLILHWCKCWPKRLMCEIWLLKDGCIYPVLSLFLIDLLSQTWFFLHPLLCVFYCLKHNDWSFWSSSSVKSFPHRWWLLAQIETDLSFVATPIIPEGPKSIQHIDYV